MGVKQPCPDIFEHGVIQVELALHSLIGHPAPALEHIQDLIQEFFKGHRHPSANQMITVLSALHRKCRDHC
jgi:hypothetical protein